MIYHGFMSTMDLPVNLKGAKLHLVGIKGTGMCALAELLHASGCQLSGSDGTDHFYTDEILKDLGIPFKEGFSPSNLPGDTELVIYSAAYDSASNPELALASKLHIPMMKYTEALGSYSRRSDASGITGVHGKTTTTALAGILARAVRLPAQILVGSAVGNFENRCTLSLGNKYFIAETCEYRKHFLAYEPKRIVITSIESDHQDFYPTYHSILDAFVEYAMKLPDGGELIYCADDPGASEAADIVRSKRDDLCYTAYGMKASGPFRILSITSEAERTVLRLAGFPEDFCLRMPGRHLALDAVGALALITSIMKAEFGSSLWTLERQRAVQIALESFRGSRRRSEIIGEVKGILIMDDYGHHPTAIILTLEGLRAFYPTRRLIISFMSHTYTRTAALLDEFAQSLRKADLVFLHRIYSSAREHYTGGVDGHTLYERTVALMGDADESSVYYFDDPMNSLETVLQVLKPGDLFLTLGAGDNWQLGKAVYERLSSG